MVKATIFGEKIDLMQFLPGHLSGSTTAVFLRAFQDYINEMYEYRKDNNSPSCKLSEDQYRARMSLLGKINDLATLHDPKKVDAELIGRLADLLGYDFGISTTEIMNMVAMLAQTGNVDIPMDDNIDNNHIDYLPVPVSACGVNDYSDKATEFMRQILVELPYWFQIKGTDKLAKIFFWCFGLAMKWEYGYTKTYTNNSADWQFTQTKDDTSLVIEGYIPTPHVKASFGLDESFGDKSAIIAWLNNQGLSRVVDTLSSIKPISVVIDEVSFFLTFRMPSMKVAMSLGIENYHIFKTSYGLEDSVWDAGLGGINPIDYILSTAPTNYTLRNQNYTEFLQGALNVPVSGTLVSGGINTGDPVFTFQTPAFQYAQDNIITLETFPTTPSSYYDKYVYVQDERRLYFIIDEMPTAEKGDFHIYEVSTGTTYAPGQDYYLPMVLEINVITNNNETMYFSSFRPEYETVIDWGDGNTTSSFGTNINHSFSMPGTYTVKVLSGYFQNIISSSFVYGSMILSKVKKWGSAFKKTEEITNYFTYNYNDVLEIPKNFLGFENVRILRKMFSNCSNLTHIGSFAGLENVTDMTECFVWCDNLQSLPTTFYGLNSLVSARYLFSGASITNIPTTGYEVLHNVTDCYCMFFNNPNIVNDIFGLYSYLSTKEIQVVNHTQTFYYCTSAIGYDMIPSDWK